MCEQDALGRHLCCEWLCVQGTDENGCRVTDGDLISPAEFLLLLSSPDIDPETDVEAMERLAHIMESIGKTLENASSR